MSILTDGSGCVSVYILARAAVSEQTAHGLVAGCKWVGGYLNVSSELCRGPQSTVQYMDSD